MTNSNQPRKGLVDFFIDRESEQVKPLNIAGAAFLAILVITTLLNSFVIVNAGYRGVLLNMGAPVATLGEGFHPKIPYLQSVEMMSVQILKHEGEEGAASKDLQVVTTRIAVNYRIDPSQVMNVYTNLRFDAENRVIEPAIQESIKAATATFTAEELITRRDDVKMKFDLILVERLAQYNVLVSSVSITDFDFSPSFNAAIESKVTQQQKALEAENKLKEVAAEQQQKVITAQAEKNATIARAEGEARSKVLAAEADATATLTKAVAQSEANKKLADAQAYQIDLINQKIASSPKYIEWAWIQEWDGTLPQYMLGDGSATTFLFGLGGINK